MKIVFLGTPQFATVTLERLIESPRHEVACVVTQPDKPAGRGRKLTPPPVKVLAESAGIAVHQPASARDGELERIVRESQADAAVVVAYGKILPPAMLDIPRHGFLNVHASQLPKYRGAAPIQWAIARGERKTGVTIMRITEGLDSGPILGTREVDILEDDDAQSLYDMLSVLGADLMIEVLDRLDREGAIEAVPQDDAQATFAPIIRRDDARIDWQCPAEEIICLVRGFVLWPGAHTKFDGREVKILAAEAIDPQWIEVAWKDERILPGTIVDVLKAKGFVVKTGGDGLLVATRVKLEGKKEMDAESAVNGGLIRIGMRAE